MRYNVKLRDGFTLLELLISISIIAVLTSISIGEYSSTQGKARDAKRLADIKQIERGLVQYYAQYGDYPVADTSEGNMRGWEASAYSVENDPTKQFFISQITPYLNKVPLDPINNINTRILTDDTYMFYTGPKYQEGSFFYNYYRYPDGQYYGCTWSGPFAVLGIRALERTDTTNLPKARCGPQPCALGGQNLGTASACRDWSNEFDYSVFLVP